MIDVLGDRRNTGYCLRCGTTLLILPWNQYQCCGECTNVIETVSRRENNKPEKKDKISRFGIPKQMILRRTSPEDETS